MKQEYNHSEIMNAKEVAKYLGIHVISVYRLIKDTNIPTFKLKGQWRFKKPILDEWIKNKIEKGNKDGRRAVSM